MPCRCFAAHDGHLVWPGISAWEQVLQMPSSLGPLSFVALALEGVLFTLGPLTSGLFVFAAFLLALLKFEGGWSTARPLVQL